MPSQTSVAHKCSTSQRCAAISAVLHCFAVHAFGPDAETLSPRGKLHARASRLHLLATGRAPEILPQHLMSDGD